MTSFAKHRHKLWLSIYIPKKSNVYIPGAAYTCFFFGGNLKTGFFSVIWKKTRFFQKKTVFFDFHLKGQIYHEFNDSVCIYVRTSTFLIHLILGHLLFLLEKYCARVVSQHWLWWYLGGNQLTYKEDIELNTVFWCYDSPGMTTFRTEGTVKPIKIPQTRRCLSSIRTY